MSGQEDLPPRSESWLSNGDIGVSPVRRTSIMRERMAEMVASAPERMRERLAQEDEVNEYCDILLDDMRDRDCNSHRTAMRLIPEILKAVGSQNVLVLNLWQKIGASDEHQARRFVEMGLQAEGMDPETKWRMMETACAQYRREHGLPELVERGGSDAQVVE